MRPHPKGFHRDEDARSRCLACSDPDALTPTGADEELARKLIADGWQQTSSKYRRVCRSLVPDFSVAMTFSSEVPTWLRERMRDSFAYWSRHGLMFESDKIERMELTPAQFRAFKKFRGGVA